MRSIVSYTLHLKTGRGLARLIVYRYLYEIYQSTPSTKEYNSLASVLSGFTSINLVTTERK